MAIVSLLVMVFTQGFVEFRFSVPERKECLPVLVIGLLHGGLRLQNVLEQDCVDLVAVGHNAEGFLGGLLRERRDAERLSCSQYIAIAGVDFAKDKRFGVVQRVTGLLDRCVLGFKLVLLLSPV